MTLIESLFNIIAPHDCVGCGREGSLLCSECVSAQSSVLPRCYNCRRLSDDFRTCQRCRRQTSVSQLYTAFAYEGAAKRLLHRLKFERAQAAAEPIAELLAGVYTGATDVLVTYVPTANQRVRERGYDQSALVAKALARRLNCAYAPLLARTDNRRQVGQRRAARKTQMQAAFRALPRAAHQQRVLLVDDVLTTGATCEAATRTLRSAGVQHVSAIVFAAA